MDKESQNKFLNEACFSFKGIIEIYSKLNKE